MTHVPEPAYEPATPKKTDARYVTADGSPAPKLMVRFRCPDCSYEVLIDAYQGPVSCGGLRPLFTHGRVWMDPIVIVRNVEKDGLHPDSYTMQRERTRGTKTE
jgi:hypothetical protein